MSDEQKKVIKKLGSKKFLGGNKLLWTDKNKKWMMSKNRIRNVTRNGKTFKIPPQ